MSTVAISKRYVVLSGSFLCRMRSRTLRSFGVRLCLAVCLAALGLVLAYGSAVAQCIDYGDYLHWVGRVQTPGYAYGVAVVENHSYVADGSSGLQVLDITNPESPVIVGSVRTPGQFQGGVAVIGSHAYVGTDGDFWVIDIMNPASPAIVGNVHTPYYVDAVAVVGSYAYVADFGAGVQVIDVTNPAGPAIVGSVRTASYASGVAVLGNYVYVADYYFGLQVLSAQCSDATAIEEPESGDVPGAAMLAIQTVSPNPFNPSLEVSFESRGSGGVTMEIYDASGSRVRTVPLGVLGPGAHQAWWDGRNASGEDARSGVYFVRLRGSEGQSRAVKAVLVR